jgi:hypothetical protein
VSKFTGLAFAACLAAAFAPASATPVTWTLQNVVFDDGATASGTFVYDASTGTLGAVAITTTSGPVVTGASYVLNDPGFGPGTNVVDVVTGTFADYTGLPVLQLYMAAPMTNAGGTIALVFGGTGEGICGAVDCNWGSVSRQGGGFITAGTTPSVPEPATISMLLLGLFGLGMLYRRTRSEVR